MKSVEHTRAHIDIGNKDKSTIDKLLSRLSPYEIIARRDNQVVVTWMSSPYLRAPILSTEPAVQRIMLQYGRGEVEVTKDEQLTDVYHVGSVGQLFKNENSWVFVPNAGPYFFRAGIPGEDMNDAVFTGIIHLGVALSSAGGSK